MRKRTFLKYLATVSCGGFFSRAGALSQAWGQAVTAAKDELVKWAGNYRYSTDKLFKPDSMAQVPEFVKRTPALKVLGTKHCFNGIADSTEQLVSLRSMNQALDLSEDKRSVTVQAGISYGQLSPWLDQRGVALHNLASLPHISVAGACATGTHGSGVNNGNLATAVSAVEFINAAGETIRLSRDQDGDTFSGAVVHLGAIGVVTKITLDVQPTFRARQYVYRHLALDKAMQNFDAIMSRGYSVSMFTMWDEIDEVWIKLREDQPFDASTEFFEAQPATVDMHPIPELSAEHCTQQMGIPGPWYDRLPHFRMGFTPSSGEELQSEYFVPLDRAVDAIGAIARLRDQIQPHLMISELRTIASDQLWMSPCYQRPNLAIHFTWKQDWPAVSRLLPIIERELSAYQVRPHWGKLFLIDPKVLRPRYERIEDFKRLVSRFDPDGKFRNRFLHENLYA